jgi:hypothetical protein
MQDLVALGELFQVTDGGCGRAGVTGGVGGGWVEQPEHGPAGGHGVFPRREHLRGQRCPGGAELIEQAGGIIEHGHQRLGISHRPTGRG